jgi:hypothetical protein
MATADARTIATPAAKVARRERFDVMTIALVSEPRCSNRDQRAPQLFVRTEVVIAAAWRRAKSLSALRSDAAKGVPVNNGARADGEKLAGSLTFKL